MKEKKYILGRAVCILLLFVLLQACSGSSNQDEITPPPTQNGSAPTNTPFQPVSNTAISATDAGALPSVTSDGAFPAPTNSSDNPTSSPSTVPPNSSTSAPPTQPPGNTTAQGPVPPSEATITPDSGTPPPPGDPSIAIVPYSINAGGTLQIILGEFGANENVTIEVHLGTRLNNLQNSFVVTVNNAGDLTFNWTVPQNYAAGNYSIRATGQTYGKKIAGYFMVQ
jgi:hypothetical protein